MPGWHEPVDLVGEQQKGPSGSVPIGVAYVAVEESYGACGSCRRPGVPPESTRAGGDVDQEAVGITTKWLGHRSSVPRHFPSAVFGTCGLATHVRK